MPGTDDGPPSYQLNRGPAAVPPRRVGGVPRLEPVWFERFAELSSCDVADAVGPLYTVAPEIGPLYTPIPRLVGQALTAKACPGDSLAIHGALAQVQPGDVLIVDWRGHTDSCGSGSQVLVDPRRAGLRGVVIDGAWRDVDELARQGFPMFGRGRSAHSPPKRQPGEVNVAVCCGGVIVEPGDLVVADAEGIVVVPRRAIAQVWEACNKVPTDVSASESIARAARRAAFFEQEFTRAGGIDSVWSSPDLAQGR